MIDKPRQKSFPLENLLDHTILQFRTQSAQVGILLYVNMYLKCVHESSFPYIAVIIHSIKGKRGSLTF